MASYVAVVAMYGFMFLLSFAFFSSTEKTYQSSLYIFCIEYSIITRSARYPRPSDNATQRDPLQVSLLTLNTGGDIYAEYLEVNQSTFST